MFMEWKSAVHAGRHARYKRRLEAKLFLSDTWLAPSLLHLRSMCLNMSAVPMFNVDLTRTYTLEVCVGCFVKLFVLLISFAKWDLSTSWRGMLSSRFI